MFQRFTEERGAVLYCDSQALLLKDRYSRTLKHTRIGNRLICVRVEVYKSKCLECGRYSSTRLPGVLPRRRATENFRLRIYLYAAGTATQLSI
ncbi:MAG: hypothetical protein EA369_00045 [Bradymonadales bacterium]|nr:MAG: hypothetical protein EA369_00045 [Bradymonadales bacterium]